MQRIDVTGGAQRMLIAADYALTVEGVTYRVRRWCDRARTPEGMVRVSFYVNSIVCVSPFDVHAWYLTPSVNGLPFYTMPFEAWDNLLER